MDLDKISQRINNIKPDILGITKDIKDSIEIAKIRPEMSLASLRKITEKILCDIYEIEYKQPPRETNIQKVKNQLLSKGVLPRRIRNHVDTIQDFGNMSIHHQAGDIEIEDIEMCFNSLASIYKWYVDKYALIKEDNTIKNTQTKTDNQPDEIYQKTEGTKTQTDKNNNQNSVDNTSHKTTTEKPSTGKKKKSSPAKILIPIFILIAFGVFAFFFLPDLLDRNGTDNIDDDDDEVRDDSDRIFREGQMKMELEATQNLTNKIILDWKQPQENLIYNIYKKVSGRDDYSKLSDTSNTDYQDEDVVNSVIYMYKVEAVDNEKTLGFQEISATTSTKFNQWIDYSPIITETPPERRNFAMATLEDGKVIIFGGKNEQGLLNDMWLYDMETHFWKEIKTNANPKARESYDMVSMGDNRVLLFGGKGESGNLADTWIYNGENNRWVQHSQTDDQSPSARAYHDLAFDGRNTIMLFGGGQQTSRGYYTDLYEFNISENRWFKIYDSINRSNNSDVYPEARIYHSLSYIAQSRIVLFGGYDGKRNLGDTWIYTTHNNQWERADFNDDMARNLHSVISPQSGKLIMCGGYEDNSKSDTWVFDLGSKKWSMVRDAALPFGIHNHEIARLDKDILLMFGGIDYGQEFVRNTYIYHYEGK